MKNDKPGCFGLGVVHAKSPTCKACKHCPACRKSALSTLQEVNKRVAIPQLLAYYSDIDPSEPTREGKPSLVRRSSVKVELTMDQKRRFALLPKKAKAVATTMARRGVDIRGRLQCGQNPFNAGKNCYLRIACDLYLKGDFSMHKLKAEYRQRFSHWTSRTLSSQLSLAYALISQEGGSS